MEKLLIDQITILQDDREIIPYCLSSEPSGGPHENIPYVNTDFEEMTPLCLKYIQGKVEREVWIYMPKKIRRITGISDIILGQSDYINELVKALDVARGTKPKSWWCRLWETIRPKPSRRG